MGDITYQSESRTQLRRQMKPFWVIMWGFLKEVNTNRLGHEDHLGRHLPMYCESYLHPKPEKGMLLSGLQRHLLESGTSAVKGGAFRLGLDLHLTYGRLWRFLNYRITVVASFYMSTYVNSLLPICVLSILCLQKMKMLSNAMGTPSFQIAIGLGDSSLTMWPSF